MLDSDEAEAAVQFLVDLMWKHQVSPSPQIYHGLGNMFETGMAAMAIGNMADLDVYRRIDSFDWDVAMVPGGPAKSCADVAGQYRHLFQQQASRRGMGVCEVYGELRQN